MTRLLASERGDRGGDEDGSLMLALLISFVSVVLSTLLLPVVLNGMNLTRLETRRAHALNAAQTGLEAVMGQIRGADDGAGNGVRSKLPCGPLSGVVTESAASYSTSVYYVVADPMPHMQADKTWFTVPANRITCTAGSGPSIGPAYAVVYSTGTYQGSNRELRGAYRLRTTNRNILGGQIHLWQPTPATPNLCFEAGNMATVAPGTKLQVQDCDTTGTRLEQIFAYTPELTLKLVNSVNATYPLGLCLDAGPLPRVEGTLVVFQPCQSPVPTRQQWRYNSGAQVEGATGSTTTDGFVFQLSAAATRGFVHITSPGFWDGSYNDINGFGPDTAVGPGNAGPEFGQLVNFNRFGQCLDLNGGNYTLGYLIAWPCKPTWNQAFTVPPLSTSMYTATAGTFYMTVAAGSGSPTTPPGTYCLQSPRSTAAWTYPSLVTCSSASTTPALQWKVYGNTGDYASSYRIRDVDGNCLQAGDPNGGPSDVDRYGSYAVSRIVMRTCSASTLQKWNADPNILDGLPMQYLGEN